MEWIIGIFSGIISSLIIILTGSYLIPLLKGFFENTIKISGRYMAETKNPSGNMQHYELIIKQFGNKLKASLAVETINKKAPFVVFKLKGSIKDRLVLLHGRAKNNKYVTSNSYLLEVKKGGNSLIGKKLWFSKTNDTVESFDIEYIRKKTY